MKFDIFVTMKLVLFILFIIPSAIFAQYDFDTRYFKIDATALPEVTENEYLNTNFSFVPSSKNIMSSFRMNASNYREPVDMMSALNEQTSFIKKEVDIPALQQRTFGFSVNVSGSNSFDGTFQGSTSNHGGVRNIAYKEMRSVYFCSPSPSSSTAGIRN